MTWPFPDAASTAALTSGDVLDRGMFVALVTHDADDGTWQFHSVNGAPTDDSEARVVGLGTILALDPSLAGVGALPLGWMARRLTRGGTWQNSPID
jgi:hypothetical protein